jgi:hypothetical protein
MAHFKGRGKEGWEKTRVRCVYRLQRITIDGCYAMLDRTVVISRDLYFEIKNVVLYYYTKPSSPNTHNGRWEA